MAVALEEFRRYVQPYASGVTPFEVAHHIREALRDFCARTKCWQVLLDPFVTAAGSAEYTLTPPAGAAISQVEEVFVSEARLDFAGLDDLYTLTAGNWRTAAAGTPLQATFLEPGRLRLHTTPDAVATVYVRAALKPSASATLATATLPDFLFEQWAQDIANGALTRLYATPDKPYSNPQLSLERGTRYEVSVGDARLRVARSFGRRELESVAQFY